LALDNLKPFRLPLYRKAKRFCIEPGTAAVLKVVTNEKGEAVGDVLTIIC
jgi:hypothetical protein